jgi:hypothetical protein
VNIQSLAPKNGEVGAASRTKWQEGGKKRNERSAKQAKRRALSGSNLPVFSALV